MNEEALNPDPLTYANRLQCLNCDYWSPRPHEGWKPNEYDRDKRYAIYHLRAYLHDAKGGHEPHIEHGWPGHCLFHPTPVEARSAHLCGQWKVNPYMVDNWKRMVGIHYSIAEVVKLSAQLNDLKGVHRRLIDRVKRRRMRREKVGQGAAVKETRTK